MNISIFGLGYVGSVLAGCLSKLGHTVIGIDADESKVRMMAQGRSPVVEPGLDLLIAEGVHTGLIRSSTDFHTAVRETTMSLICVGTPSDSHGGQDLRFVRRVAQQIGQAIAGKKERHLVVVRSTVLPGTVENVIAAEVEEASGLRRHEGFGILMNPEFLRESSAVDDFLHPSLTVIGARSKADAAVMSKMYEALPGEIVITSISAAELVKYCCNAFHATKIVFANEIGSLCRELGVDSHEVMRIFALEKKLNISAAYLRPGFAFGGSCLPKDLRALARLARENELELPLLSSLEHSNRLLIERVLGIIIGSGAQRIGLLGFAFKAGTDDLRESPMVTLTETLLGKGYDLRLHDAAVQLARITGSNLGYIERHIPHLSRIMVETPEELIAHAELIVLGNQQDATKSLLPLLHPAQTVLDLCPSDSPPPTSARYLRVCG